MKNKFVDRRDFFQMLGIGAATLGCGLTLPEESKRTNRGVLVESNGDYDGYLVEKLNEGIFPYEIDPGRITRMSEKNNTFSRNIWDPARTNRPEVTENLANEYLIAGEGKVPNQTRLDYALMAASWKTAREDTGESYHWKIKRHCSFTPFE